MNCTENISFRGFNSDEDEIGIFLSFVERKGELSVQSRWIRKIRDSCCIFP